MVLALLAYYDNDEYGREYDSCCRYEYEDKHDHSDYDLITFYCCSLSMYARKLSFLLWQLV